MVKQSKSDRQFQSSLSNFGAALFSPFKAAGQVVTASGADKVAKPTRTILEGGVSLVTGFVDLSLSIASSFAESERKSRYTPKTTKTEAQWEAEHRKNMAEITAQKYASLLVPVELPEPVDPSEPREYWSHIERYTTPDGEIVEIEAPHRVLKCHQAYCEGNGEFIFTDKQAAKFREYGMDDPLACDPCKFWRYEQELLGNRMEPCEICGRQFYITAKEQISYHKKDGNPIISRKCNCEYLRKQRLDEQRQLSLFYNPNRDTISRYIDQREVPESLKKDKAKVADFLKNKGIANVYARIKNNPPMSKELIDSSQYPNLYTRGNQNVFDHLWKHINGSENGDRTMSKYSHPVILINYAHSIAHVNDPGRFLEITEDNGKSHKKFDMTTGEMFVFNTIGDTAYLRTAYIPLDDALKDKIKGTQGFQPTQAEYAKSATEKFIQDMRRMAK